MIPRSRPGMATCVVVLASSVSLPGCYQGEWRTGTEVPVSSTSRLLPTRDVERWDLETTATPYVVRVRAEITPRCRNAQFGKSRRTDVGRFRRTGGGYWKAAAITTGILGGVSTLTGGAGWVSRDAGPYARPAMYAVGGLVAVGGIINCILAIQKSSPARTALCGALLGGGASVLLGTGLSQLETTRQVVDPLMPMGTPQTVIEPLISTDAFKGMVYGGAAGVGVAGVSGTVAALWRGEQERSRVIEQENTSLWDRQQGETGCGPLRPLTGRTATLEVTGERLTEGPGSDAEPLRMRVAVGDEGRVAVDLRPLRQALPECGVLRVQLNPDTLYEQFSEDFVPGAAPQVSLPAARPIHGQIVPPQGLTLQGLEGRQRRQGRVSVPGFSDELVAGLARRCKAEAGRAPGFGPPPESAPAAAGGDAESRPVYGPPAPEPATETAAPRAEGGAAECSPERRQAMTRECELSCGKSLEVGACVFERRKCSIDARFSPQKARDLELCELSWEKCIFKGGVGPAAWGRCVEGCEKKNEATLCRPD